MEVFRGKCILLSSSYSLNVLSLSLPLLFFGHNSKAVLHSTANHVVYHKRPYQKSMTTYASFPPDGLNKLSLATPEHLSPNNNIDGLLCFFISCVHSCNWKCVKCPILGSLNVILFLSLRCILYVFLYA